MNIAVEWVAHGMRTVLLSMAFIVLVGGIVAVVAFSGGETPEPQASPTAQPASSPTTAAPTIAPTSTSANTPLPTGAGRDQLPEPLALLTENWVTDWTQRNIDLTELIVGIRAPDPRDRIPPIDEPVFDAIDDGNDWLDDREPGVLLDFNGEQRFYPLAILTRHEIVNDDVGGTPIALTYCPLCNTAIAFDRTVDGTVLRLGTSGLLRNSDLVMWDDVTQSLWQQITGEAIVGSMTGTQLEFLPAAIVSWGDFKDGFPSGVVLSRDLGFGIRYGANPYVGYSQSARPFLFSGEIDNRFPALERVVGVTIGDESKAYPFSIISGERAINDTLGGTPIVVFWGSAETADALDGPIIADSQGIGTGVAYERNLDGQVLTFTARDDGDFTDEQTGSTWNILGQATAGPLAGNSLPRVVHRNEFWFAWQAFFSDAAVYGE